MAIELTYRGFEVSNIINDRYMKYFIDDDGMENVIITKGKTMHARPRVWIRMDEGTQTYLCVGTKQYDSQPEDESSKEQATRLHEEVKKLLDVDIKLKTYVPQFSSMSEITPFNVLGIEDISDLEKMTETQS